MKSITAFFHPSPMKKLMKPISSKNLDIPSCASKPAARAGMAISNMRDRIPTNLILLFMSEVN